MSKRKTLRERSKIRFSEYFKKLKEGDKVAVVREKSVSCNFPKRIQEGRVPLMFAHNIMWMYPQCTYAINGEGKIVPKWENKDDEEKEKIKSFVKSSIH